VTHFLIIMNGIGSREIVGEIYQKDQSMKNENQQDMRINKNDLIRIIDILKLQILYNEVHHSSNMFQQSTDSNVRHHQFHSYQSGKNLESTSKTNRPINY
jgi:hypothetical protein